MQTDEPVFQRVIEYAARADGDVVDMVSGHPDWEPPEGIRDGLTAYATSDSAAFQYPPVEGLESLREEIAARRSVALENVLVTNGAGEANYLALAAALEHCSGSTVVCTDPVYPYYPTRVELLDATLETVPTETDGTLEPDRVRETVTDETAAILINTPNNPTGAVYDADTMAACAEAAEAHDALLVSDEVYDHFDYSGEFSSGLALDSPNCIVTTSMSKSLAITGFRVGYLVAPRRLVESLRTRHMLTNVTVSRPAQAAVLVALETTGPEYYQQARDRLSKRIDGFCDALDELGATYTRPSGGFYVLATIPGVAGSRESVEALIDEAGVAGMPGAAFGEHRATSIRFALLTDRVEEAGDRLVEYVN